MSKKVENFKEMEKKELLTKLVQVRESLRVLKFKTEGSKSKNVKEAGAFKKEIARILTEINRK